GAGGTWVERVQGVGRGQDGLACGQGREPADTARAAHLDFEPAAVSIEDRGAEVQVYGELTGGHGGAGELECRANLGSSGRGVPQGEDEVRGPVHGRAGLFELTLVGERAVGGRA